MAKIKQIKAIEILDAKGNPTIETTVILNDGAVGVASTPSGTSVGSYEAVEIRDKDEAHYGGKSVSKAIEIVENTISPNLIGMDSFNQAQIDKTMIELDGTQNKSRLGANAMISVSMAVAKASAKSSVLPLFLYLRQFIKKDNVNLRIPTPLFDMISGGLHAGQNVNFQEFLLMPSTAQAYEASLEMAVAIYNALRIKLQEVNAETLVGDEGGFGPRLSSNIDAFSLIRQATEAANYKLGFDVFFALDADANNFYSQQQYTLKDRSMPYSATDLIGYYQDLVKQYNLLYIEDPFAEDDWEAWGKLMEKLASSTLIVGDDLTVTNPYRLQMAIDKKAINAIVIKPNQIGTVIETIAVVEVARSAGLKIIVSNRSGETDDEFIADFAVAVSSDYVKFGAPVRGERVAKYNRLLQIEKQLKVLADDGTIA